MAFFSTLCDYLLPELQQFLTDATRPKEVPEEEHELWLQEVAVCIAGQGVRGINFLLGHLERARAILTAKSNVRRDLTEKESMRLRAILLGLSISPQSLSDRKRAAIGAIIESFLHHLSAVNLPDAVDALTSLQCRAARNDVLRLQDHSSPFVIGSVLRFMAKLFPDEAVPLLEEALGAKEPIVRENAIDELDELDYVPALPKIKRLLKDKDKDVREAAATAVNNLEKSA